jgi:F-type H+-transporting ATPase subunit a
MADPILHIKDSYFFEVPKALWRYDYKTWEEVPSYVLPKEYHGQVSIAEVNQEMSGKIVIPQWFGGELRNLYESESGFCISKFMIVEVLVAVILIVVFRRLARNVEGGGSPTGKFWNTFEAMLLFVREQIAKPTIGEHDADRFVPLLWTMFFFILTCNLFGLIPIFGAPTGSWGVTLALACITFGTVLIAGIMRFGPIGFWLNQIPHMELPFYFFPLKVMIWVIEVAGLLIRHGVLSVRLLANMVAGHLVLLGIMGLIIAAAESTTAQFSLTATISVLGSAAFTFLELLVAFLQAYIFTFLSALFIGAAVHEH